MDQTWFAHSGSGASANLNARRIGRTRIRVRLQTADFIQPFIYRIRILKSLAFDLCVVDGATHTRQSEFELFEFALLLRRQTVLSCLYGAVDFDLGFGIGHVRIGVLSKMPPGKAVGEAHALHGLAVCGVVTVVFDGGEGRCVFSLCLAAFVRLDGQ